MELDFTDTDTNHGEEGGAILNSTLRGAISRIVFQNPENGYAVCRLKEENQNLHTIVGVLPNIQEGQDIDASGRWENHPDHGMQFHVQTFRTVLPSTNEGIRKYLSSGVLPGIGPAIAAKIVERFGADTIRILDNESDKLLQINGIGRKLVNRIRDAWKGANADRETRMFLQSIGLSPAFCTKVIVKYGMGAAPEIVRRNPYRLASDIDGIGFLSADAIAMKLGLAKDSPLRLCAGATHVLDMMAGSGHVCTPLPLLLETMAKLLEAPEEQLQAGVRTACAEGKIIAEHSSGKTALPEEIAFSPIPPADPWSQAMQLPEDGSPDEILMYSRPLRAAEIHLAEAIQVLLRTQPAALRIPALGDGWQTLNPEQRQAVEYAFQYGFSIVTGGPGVGKTTVIRQIADAARFLRQKTLFAAPTGRAAKRMAESTGREAQTIHRLLKWDVPTRTFSHNADNPLPCDLLIIDEASMLDVQLAQCLFQAVSPGTRLLLVGDKDQLPSVGPGAVLHDLIACGKIPVTFLSKVYRQSADSRIITNAHAVNRRQMPDLTPCPGGQKTDFYWIEQDDPLKAADLITRMTTERIPQVFGFHPTQEIQVLSPMRKGECGTIVLNEKLQQAINPPSPGKAEFRLGTHVFRLGDKVMQTTNNYDKGVFNGETGIITAIDAENRRFQVQFDIGAIQYQQNEADQLQLAYAATVHKSQGSEFPAVLLPVLTQHFMMLQKNLLYTAMTRAKKLLILVGSRRALTLAVQNDTPTRRRTRLAWRLQQLLRDRSSQR